MEVPKNITSAVEEIEGKLVITTPKRKSWTLVVVFAFVLVIYLNAFVHTLFASEFFDGTGRLFALVASLLILYFSVRGLAWQLKGMTEVRVDSNQLIITTSSPLSTKVKSYDLSEIRDLEVKDEAVSTGPMAMLQLLGITDRVKLVMVYGYESIAVISGVDFVEAIELRMHLKNKLASS
jgi:hypothetical protein